MIKTNRDLLAYCHELATTHTGLLKHTTFTKGSLVITQDEPAGDLYVLKSGVVKCFITEENGRDYVLEFLGEGEMVGELELLMKKANLGSVQALTIVEAYRISPSTFTTLLSQDQVFTGFLLTELATRLSRTARRAAYQQIFPLQYALLKVLYLFSETKQTVSKQDLADYLAISTRSLNRLLKQIGINEYSTSMTEGLSGISPSKLLALMQNYY